MQHLCPFPLGNCPVRSLKRFCACFTHHWISIPQKSSVTPLLSWMLASLSARVTRPWMWTFKEEGVPISVARWSIGLQHFKTPLNWSLDLSFHFPPFFYSPTPIGYSLIHSWITPFLHVFSNSSDIHGNQATVSTSATKRSAHGSPWKTWLSIFL